MVSWARRGPPGRFPQPLLFPGVVIMAGSSRPRLNPIHLLPHVLVLLIDAHRHARRGRRMRSQSKIERWSTVGKPGKGSSTFFLGRSVWHETLPL